MSDELDEIQKRVDANDEIFKAERAPLIARYHRARSAKTKLRALAKIMRHYAQYVSQGVFGDPESHIEFAKQLERIAEEDL